MDTAIAIPPDFRGVVVTLPPDMGTEGIIRLNQQAAERKLDKLPGHRILHLHQVARMDSSAVATLVDLVARVRGRGYEVALCEPPPVVRSYLDIYGAGKLVEGSVLFSGEDGSYVSDLVPFVPPFVPEPRGRIDVYSGGKIQSFVLGNRGLQETAPVNLALHSGKVATRAQTMALHVNDHELREVRAGAFVWVRRHLCGCGSTHTTFERIHRLHRWYVSKGFDFLGLELWASDVPAGMVVEKLAFRDRAHHGQFEVLRKVDTAWREFGTDEHEIAEEYYYAFA